MKKNSISKYFLVVSITTFLSVFMLMVHRSYVNLITPTKVVNSDNLLKPINPKLDTQIILEFEQKTEYPDSQVRQSSPSALTSPLENESP